MDDTFISPKKFSKLITSVVVVSIMSAFCFSVPQAYAMGTNENSSSHLDQNYISQTKLSDFISKVSTFFSQQLSNRQTISQTNNQETIPQSQAHCKQDLELPFVDIQGHEYQQHIMSLYDKWIIIWSQNKFMPNDHLNFYCMIKIIVDSYRSKLWYDLDSQLWLSHRNYFSNAWSGIDNTSLKYLNTAYELWLLEWISDMEVWSKFYFQQTISYATLSKIFSNISKQFPLLIDDTAIQEISNSLDIVSRWEYTKYIVDLFDFDIDNLTNICQQPNNQLFLDTDQHDCKDYIQILGDLWIIDTNQSKFYPDNYLRNYEFTIMLTKTILYKEKRDLEIYVLEHTSKFSDLESQSSYIKYFEYAYRYGLLSYIIDDNTWKAKAQPNKFMTVQEINQTLTKLLWYDINFQSKLSNGLITRWEFANVLVSWFNLWESSPIQTSDQDNSNNTIDVSWSIIKEISWWIKSAKLISQAYNASKIN